MVKEYIITIQSNTPAKLQKKWEYWLQKQLSGGTYTTSTKEYIYYCANKCNLTPQTILTLEQILKLIYDISNQINYFMNPDPPKPSSLSLSSSLSSLNLFIPAYLQPNNIIMIDNYTFIIDPEITQFLPINPKTQEITITTPPAPLPLISSSNFLSKQLNKSIINYIAPEIKCIPDNIYKSAVFYSIGHIIQTYFSQILDEKEYKNILMSINCFIKNSTQQDPYKRILLYQSQTI